MDDNTNEIPMMLITANVGSIFEDPEVLLKSWVAKFLSTISELKPKFLALHCQEVGGKNYEDSMIHVDTFVRTLTDSAELSEYSHVKIFLDEDFSCTEKFTALGNLYFVHNSAVNWKIWDFNEQLFVPANGQNIYSGNIESVSLKEKDKFPQDFFPECKWSRKGFMRTRWNLDGSVFDLINIHLFHDASNFTAMESFPSAYTITRQHALQYTLDRIESDSLANVPFFIFGDFNFRLNTGAVIKKLTENSKPKLMKSAKNEDEVDGMIYENEHCEQLLTLGKKVFKLMKHEDTFSQAEHRAWLLEVDCEAAMFASRLKELKITFPPSYPFTEDNDGTTYMKTRCPSWCDRILFSPSARTIFDGSNASYDMLGKDVPMGDHKPIYLFAKLNAGAKGVRNLAPEQDCLEINELTEEPSRSNRVTKSSKASDEPSSSSVTSSTNSVPVTQSGRQMDKSMDKTTRYIYVEYNDRVSVFRETTV